MNEFSLALGFGWIGLGAISALALLYRRWTLAIALVCASLASSVIDFAHGSIAARAFGPIIVLVAVHAIVRELRRAVRPPAAVAATPAPVEVPPGDHEATGKNVLLLRPKARGSAIWLAHDGQGVIFVTPTSLERARSGCRVGLRRKRNGEFIAVT
jgi:hypothetical protein